MAPSFCSRTSFLRLQPDLDCLSRQPFCSKTFVGCLEFWLGLAVRYRLPRRKRVESPSLELVRKLLLGRPLRLDHSLFPFSQQLYQAAGVTPYEHCWLSFCRREWLPCRKSAGRQLSVPRALFPLPSIH